MTSRVVSASWLDVTAAFIQPSATSLCVGSCWRCLKNCSGAPAQEGLKPTPRSKHTHARKYISTQAQAAFQCECSRRSCSSCGPLHCGYSQGNVAIIRVILHFSQPLVEFVRHVLGWNAVRWGGRCCYSAWLQWHQSNIRNVSKMCLMISLDCSRLDCIRFYFIKLLLIVKSYRCRTQKNWWLLRLTHATRALLHQSYRSHISSPWGGSRSTAHTPTSPPPASLCEGSSPDSAL